MSSPTQNILILGASKNIGYYASLRLLERGCRVTFLLRSVTCFDQDEVIQRFVEARSATLVQGDALKEDDVRRAWSVASAQGPVDLCIFTIGGLPHFKLSKLGFVIDPPNLVCQSVMNVLCTYPNQTPPPRLIMVSSIGLTKKAHASVPLALKPLYSYGLDGPHRDKLGAEQVLAHVAGLPWDEEDSQGEDILGRKDWRERSGMPSGGSLSQKVVIVRPALLTDGKCLADTTEKAYRVSEQELGGYTISRRDTAHFLVQIAEKYEEYAGKALNVGY